MNVSTLKPGDRVDSIQPYTIESIDKSGLNGEYEAVVRFDNGWRDRVTFPGDSDQRCNSVQDFGDGGDRCQLAHHEGQHLARAQAAPMYDSEETRAWGGGEAAKKPKWADGFPRVEHNRALN